MAQGVSPEALQSKQMRKGREPAKSLEGNPVKKEF